MISEGDGDGLAGEGDAERENEEVGCIREEIGGYDEGEGGMDDAAEVARWVEKFSNDKVDLRFVST